ncbi:nonstructural protein [Microviridae sp.]|nr:nonstructural protein [Microviridae sp.]
MELFAVRDTKSETFDLPFCQPNLLVCLRSVADRMQHDGHPWNAHPEDYQLFHVGTWDDTKGQIEAVPATHVQNLIDLVEEVPAPLTLQ